MNIHRIELGIGLRQINDAFDDADDSHNPYTHATGDSSYHERDGEHDDALRLISEVEFVDAKTAEQDRQDARKELFIALASRR